LYWTINFL